VTQEHQATRRTLLAGAGLAGVSVLAACSSGGGSSASSSAPSSSAAGGGSQPSASSGSGSGSGSGGTALGATSEIPAGGGKVFTAAKVVVTQPSSGQFKAFSAICTHQQCIVDQVANGTIDCPCHGSKFSITDGSVVAGPAPSPLPAQPITVADNQITLS
jgi:Rieske Fe-S protein